jgi:hypothetical protein
MRPPAVVEPRAVVASACRGVTPKIADHALEQRSGWTCGGQGAVEASLDRNRRRQDVATVAKQRMDLERVSP